VLDCCKNTTKKYQKTVDLFNTNGYNNFMKRFITLCLICFSITACGTVGGAVEGAGDDMHRVGKWVRGIGN
jgi:hypothetical protein